MNLYLCVQTEPWCFHVPASVHFPSPSEGELCGRWNSVSLSPVPAGCSVNEPPFTTLHWALCRIRGRGSVNRAAVTNGPMTIY